MPQRGNNQQFVGTWIDEEFQAEIDRVRKGASMSQFLRDAIFEKMERTGLKIPEKFKLAPDRKGKGGRPKKVEVTNHGGIQQIGGVGHKAEQTNIFGVGAIPLAPKAKKNPTPRKAKK